jgi:hypothetical protein
MLLCWCWSLNHIETYFQFKAEILFSVPSKLPISKHQSCFSPENTNKKSIFYLSSTNEKKKRSKYDGEFSIADQ